MGWNARVHICPLCALRISACKPPTLLVHPLCARDLLHTVSCIAVGA